MVNPSDFSSATHFVSGLYLVATPIGNLQDITLRALDLLKSADLIACEDTRISGKLLSYFGIKTQLISYNDHSPQQKRDKILNALSEDKIVALISDAGMPLISDPGYKLVQDVKDNGYYVTSLPGASAPLMALQLSALPSDKFCFLGFVPNKQKARDDFFLSWKNTPATLIVFETAPRLLACLQSIQKNLGARRVAIARELTKRFEEVKSRDVQHLIEDIEANGPPKGEIVMVIEGYAEDMAEQFDDNAIDALLQKHMDKTSMREAVEIVTGLTGKKKKEIYQRAIELKDG